ncbi:MAG: hypothetical protein ABIF11_08785 [Nitrospirota bacterium]
MKIINDGIPDVFYQAILEYNKYRKPPQDNTIAVTQLDNPPYMRFLLKKHWEEIVIPASSKTYMLTGLIMHTIFEKVSLEDALQEEKLLVKIGDVELRGRADIYKDEEISDLKFTTVYQYIFGDITDTGKQLNTYAYMFRKQGKKVKSLKVLAIFRDWRESEFIRDQDRYPARNILEIPIKLWTPEEQEKYITERINLHMVSEPPACSDEDRWLRGKKYAVMKGKNKKAVRLFEDESSANYFIIDHKKGKDMFIEERKGRYIRCESYCDCSGVCPVWKEVKSE